MVLEEISVQEQLVLSSSCWHTGGFGSMWNLRHQLLNNSPAMAAQPTAGGVCRIL